MSVSSLFSSASSSTDPLSALYAPSTTAAPTSGTSSSTSLLTSAASSASVSGSASLLSQLQQLSFSNPAAFKTATADIATQLQAEAQQTSGSQGQALSSLAAKFQQASQTGDLSSLQSSHAHHGGHHHHGGGSPASAAAAYQDNSGPFGAAIGSTAAGSSVQSQVSDIISQALTQDTGTTETIAA
jgi:hypothetical protein